jgi:hypothetical protein
VEDNLARIPFAPQEEETIASMARWMRFMAVIGIIGGILMAFAVVVGIGLVSAGQGLGEASPKWADVQRTLDQAGPWLYGLLAVGLLAAAVSLWQNFALYHAGDNFQLVARTDVADLDYLARGLDKLRTYFKIQVLVVVVTVAVAVGTALAVLAVTRQAP